MRITCRAPLRIDLAGAWTDVPEFSVSAGGAVVNAAIDHHVEGTLETRDLPRPGEDGIRICYHSALPSGAGLGGSAALNVCWLALVGAVQESAEAWRADLAEKAFYLEQLLGIKGGRQDQYASALGGINFLRFDESVRVERLEIPPAMVAELESRLVLCFSGSSRLSSRIHENVWTAFERGIPQTVHALHSLRDGAYAMRDALVSGDLDSVGRIIEESWENQKALDDSVTNDRITELFESALSAGALSGKACGAGGGGCLLFFADSGKQAEVGAALSASGAAVIPFRFDFEGVKMERQDT